MHINIICGECLVTSPETHLKETQVGYQDDQRYLLTCEKGHKTITILQEHKFELLFQVGAHALLDGYYREAVASFSSSLERFYEYFIKVIFLNNNEDKALLDSIWRLVSAQSERQLGAFIFSYTQVFNELPPILSPPNITFRNAVIHKGKFPKEAEALEYGQTVLDIISPTLDRLVKDFPDGMRAFMFSNLPNMTPECNDGKRVSTQSTATIISVARQHDPTEKIILTDELEKLRCHLARLPSSFSRINF